MQQIILTCFLFGFAQYYNSTKPVGRMAQFTSNYLKFSAFASLLLVPQAQNLYPGDQIKLHFKQYSHLFTYIPVLTTIIEDIIQHLPFITIALLFILYTKEDKFSFWCVITAVTLAILVLIYLPDLSVQGNEKVENFNQAQQKESKKTQEKTQQKTQSKVQEKESEKAQEKSKAYKSTKSKKNNELIDTIFDILKFIFELLSE